MFTLNSALHFIDTAGAHVVTVYQSASPLTVPLAGLPPERCEAYICAIKKNDLVQVYVALLTSSNKVLVYVDSRPPVRESALPGVLKEAITFAEGMGFQPEEMNLNYSAAMREVVVRGLKVFCPPKVVKKPVPRRGTAATVPLRGHEKIADVPPAKTEAQVKEESKPAPAAEKAPEPVRHGKPGDEAAALRMELVRLSAEMTAAENSARQVLAATKNELDEVRAEKEALNQRIEEFTTAAEQAAEELAAAHGEAHALRTEKAALQRHMEEELATVRGELAALGQDKDAETKAGNRAMAALQEELARLRNEKASAAAKGEELTSLHQAAQKELEAIRAELADAVKKGENAGKRAAEEVASLRVELEKSAAVKLLAEGKAAEQDEISRKGEARLTELEKDLERLGGEKEAAEHRVEELTAERDGLLTEKERLAAEMESLKARLETDENEDSFAHDLVEAKAELAKLAVEKKAAERKEKKLAAERDKLVAEVERVTSRLGELQELQKRRDLEAEQAGGAQDASLEALRSELAQLASARAEAEKRERELSALHQVTVAELAAAKAALEKGAEPAGGGQEASLAALRSELVQLASAKAEAEKRELELSVRHQITVAELAAVKAALEKAIADKIAAERGAVDAGVALQREVLPESRPEELSAAAAIGFALTAVRTPQAPWEVEGMPAAGDESFSGAIPEHPFGLGEGEDSGHFSSFFDDGLPPVLFTVDKALSAVEYGAPEDVVALQLSINVARITPDGELPQGSNAYVCSIRKENAIHVFVAMYLIESRRTIVYVPEIQPEDEGAYTKAARDALGFAEAVGFMMDTVALGDDLSKRAEILGKIPVLRQVAASKTH